MTPQSLTLSLPIRPMNPTPKHRPTAISPTMSDPCKAATRGLFRLDPRAINPKKDTIPPTIRLLLRMLRLQANGANIIISGWIDNIVTLYGGASLYEFHSRPRLLLPSLPATNAPASGAKLFPRDARVHYLRIHSVSGSLGRLRQLHF
jgi:hypothetical protein